MNTQQTLTDAMLWAAAIIVAATLGASPLLWLILLPSLALMSLLFRSRACADGSNTR